MLKIASSLVEKNQRSREHISYAAFVMLVIRYQGIDSAKELRAFLLKPLLQPPGLLQQSPLTSVCIAPLENSVSIPESPIACVPPTPAMTLSSAPPRNASTAPPMLHRNRTSVPTAASNCTSVPPTPPSN